MTSLCAIINERLDSISSNCQNILSLMSVCFAYCAKTLNKDIREDGFKLLDGIIESSFNIVTVTVSTNILQ